ncbi:hypothetical protein [Pararhizobium antarcticum]|uniref:Uncharacterized protein n=1 Tax=Pararhizobium antarcticum TaxID=1798805 RepID=A0A657LUL9_9HYPH|nr:hypothetical protein [Pararhizobium antarcticum]OJF97584.1 hypothetical protein AX760_16605 [Pararhizobium antarcticum]
MKITNTQKGPRGVNTVSGPVLIEPGQTVEVDVLLREKPHIEATGWFSIGGDYVTDAASAAPTLQNAATDATAEIEDLKKQIAERDAELAKLKGDGLDRDDLKKQAKELGIDHAGNIPNLKLKELIDAKLA